MLEANPDNTLLLRNYARFLHKVQHDMKRAEECFSWAILASPGDGESMSLYAKFIWESHKDLALAETYFERAVEAAPQDCYVIASYDHFLWTCEEYEEGNDPTPYYRILNATGRPNLGSVITVAAEYFI
ncbi:uncharacterized protein LOC131051688 isoform X2 [Cryptomeria japonica]|uniref:uncharacterized protein LOC131051688 isoform X2 n=1 Tax=Cryptomeria japonica TaxID=3369 RepID=UPI0025ABB003|nr:uncharacterized protein LOC131051688 isoform X2 [Cryptomeria japonica]